MQRPELLLKHLNRALRDLLGATSILHDDERLRSAMLPLMRRLMLAEVIGNQWMVAVGGSQGAGKTTLVRTLYNLQGEDARWLEPNEGRGEQLPILVQEDALCTRPQGVLRRFRATQDGGAELQDDPVDLATFAKATRGGDAQVMLPILKVPRRLFGHDQQALMLLPGYETVRRDNRDWQETMRLTLVGAAGCILVTDPTRLANQQQGEIQRDLLPEELRASRPLVVVSKTEGSASDPHRQQELRHSAAEVFFPDEDSATAAERVLCVGADDPAYVERWRPRIEEALRDMSAGSGADRQLQLARLARTLDQDLGQLLNRINSRAVLHLHGASGDSAAMVLQDCMRAYDESVEDLRSDYQKTIRKLLEQQAGQAWRHLEQRLGADYEGLWNKAGRLLDTVSETHIRLRDEVEQAWEHPGELLPRYVDAIRDLSGPRRLLPSRTSPEAIGQTPTTVLHQLGYVDGQGSPVTQPKTRLTEEKTHTNLRVLLQGRTEHGVTELAEDTLHGTVQLLPRMALEYSRVAAALPVLIGLQAQAAGLPESDVLGALRQVEQQFGQFREVSGSLLKGLGAMLAIDVAADAHFDLIGAIGSVFGFGSAGATTVTTVATGTAAGTVTTTPVVVMGAGAGAVAAAAVGVVAIGFIAHSAVREVRRHDNEVRQVTQAMLDNIHDQHMVHFMTRFDDLMRQLRRHLESSMRRRYLLDVRLMEHDRLACALADTRTFQRDLLDALSRSGQSLTLFHAETDHALDAAT